MVKVVKAKASAKASVKLRTTAQEIKAKRLASANNGTKYHYNDKGALTLAQVIDKVASKAIIGGKGSDLAKATGKALKANAKARRAWCLANPSQVALVSRKEIQLKKIVKGSPSARPDNAIRVRLSTHTKGTLLGYVRYLDNAQAKAKPSDKHAESVFIYRKA